MHRIIWIKHQDYGPGGRGGVGTRAGTPPGFQTYQGAHQLTCLGGQKTRLDPGPPDWISIHRTGSRVFFSVDFSGWRFRRHFV